MQSVKKINKNGSITIPKEMRVDVGLFPGNGVSVETAEDGTITIKPAVDCCRFCGSPENVLTVNKIKICNNCATQILAKVDVTDE